MINKDSKGFTLLEVLVALSIVSIALTAVLMSLTDYSRSAAHLEQKTIAHWIGLNAIADIQLGNIIAAEAPSAETGTVGMLGKEFDWVASVQKKQIINSRVILIIKITTKSSIIVNPR